MNLKSPIALRLSAILTALSLAACNKPVAEDESESPIVESTPPPATPAATPAIVAATPEPNYFAPPGVYYLVSAASVETADGIVGLKPGTKLQMTGPGKYTAGGHPLELRDSQVTNDLRIAQRAAGADQAAQAALRQAMEAQAARAAQPARTSFQGTPAPTPNTVVAVGKPAQSNRPRPGLGSSLGSSGSFNKTRSQDGWIWQLDANGNWQPIRPDK